jgi:HEPN domain-containing protein
VHLEVVVKFIEEYRVVLRGLERAYISSRYICEEFFEEELRGLFKHMSS